MPWPVELTPGAGQQKHAQPLKSTAQDKTAINR
jgi:hypothetical protein